jgi:phosphoserine aminotransferase
MYNFASGPAMLPVPVLRQSQEEPLDRGGRGFSVVETSHRSDAFVAAMEATESLLRELLAVPSNYRVLFMHGGGHQRFAMVPISLLGATSRAGFNLSRHWSVAAAAEAHDLVQLKGHRSVGGMLASLNKAMPPAGVRALTSFMRAFQRTHG